jgi:hypothetical protein
MAVVRFRERQLDRYLNSPNGTVGRYLHRKGEMVLLAARNQVGVRTGALRSSLHMRHFRDSRGQYLRIGSPLDYALAHHEGTRPHTIRPRGTTGVLVFRSRGQVVRTRIVRHPGTRPNRYLTDNLHLIK